MHYKAVIFDLDGTLLDTLEDIADSMNSVLSRSGFPIHSLEAYRNFIGDGVVTLVRRVLPEGHKDETTVLKNVLAMRKEYNHRWEEKTCPYEGVRKLLDALIIRHIKMAVLSNKPDDFTKKMVAKLLSNGYFESVIGEQPSLPKKPDPTVAINIANRLGIAPKEFLFLGDSEIDMETARRAEMYPVGALWGFRTKEELLAAGAKHLLQKPLDLLAFFN
jgi:phosphoglycolate phosphatase